MPVDCMSCCPVCKPPWMRLVDNIYPANPQDGLIKNNMSKLTFYALSNPQKLDRIGEYLSKKLNRDLVRNHMICVAIAMEAMDTLLMACHSQSLNLFVESFLKMVQKLLECSDPDMQCLATTSFVKFSNIEEDTPSYHRRYDFFVSQFSANCHSNHKTAKHRIRSAGLQGLQGVIRKTVCDELQPDIWEQHHMDKIVPSLLYNMHCNEGLNTQSNDQSTSSLAEEVFRDLIHRASYNNLKAVLRPVLLHMDSHHLWCKTDFPSACFKIIMFSVQAQYRHVVVQSLMNHLDSHSKSAAELKARITVVLSDTVIMAADGSIGPSVLDIFNSLLRHLNFSVEYNSTFKSDNVDNNKFQDAVINTIGEFANHLPDFQKIETLMFIVNKIPLQKGSSEKPTSTLLETMLLKTILKISTTYRTVLMANAFPSNLKNPLLQMSLVDRPETRSIVQHILHTLLDRHDNAEKLKKIWVPEDVSQLDLIVEKPSRQDIHFMKQGGNHILWHLLENFRLSNNGVSNIESLYTTMCLLLVELLTDDTHIDFASFILQMQDVAVLDDRISPKAAHQIHATVICFANLYSELSEFGPLQAHINEVILNRRKECSFLLPDSVVYGDHSSSDDLVSKIPKDCLLSSNVFSDVLESNGFDVSALAKPLTTPDQTEQYISSKESDVGSVSNLELDSLESPALRRNSVAVTAADQLTFDQIKTVLNTDDDAFTDEARRQQLYEEFQSASIETIMNRAQSRNKLNDRLLEILGDSVNESTEEIKPVPIDSIKYPAMFVY